MRLSSVATLVLLAVHAMGCTGLSATRPARNGAHEEMRRALLEDMRYGRLDGDAVADLARTVAEREISKAKGVDAVQRVQQARACARELEDVLQQRSEGADKAAPLAAMALLLVDRGDPDAWRSHLTSVDPDWRAVAVRTLTTSEHGEPRRRAMLDHDQQVRRAAVQAAEKAMDPADRGGLVDVARNDPDDLARVTAVRALGWVATEQDVQAMRDLWPLAPAPVQQALVSAWAFPGTMERGGLRQVLWVAETHTGTPAIIAGGILLRLGGETRGAGLAALRKAVQDGVARDRAFAIAMAPIQEPGWVEVLEKLGEEAEPSVRVAALEKLASYPKTAAAAREKLGRLAVSDRPGSAEARQAMARVGDRRVLRLLLQDAKSPKRPVRESAMRSFLALEDVARAAFFLADPDAGVRMGTACSLLSASSRW